MAKKRLSRKQYINTNLAYLGDSIFEALSVFAALYLTGRRRAANILSAGFN